VRRPSGTTVDCHDTDPAVHPGVREFSAAPYLTPAGESSFDYDCDGMETPEYPRVLSPSTAACDIGCRTAGPLIGLSTTCGDGATVYECVLDGGTCVRQPSRLRYYLACR
jgi:hypothetical protein